MNELQILKQIRYRLLSQTWLVDSGPGGSSSVGSNVFSRESVIVSAAVTPEAVGSLRAPIALLRPNNTTNDPEFDEDASLLQGGFTATIFTAVEGDGLGENPLIGGPRSGGASVSEGRGLLEVEEELFRAIGSLNDLEGIRLTFRQKSAAAAMVSEGGIYQCFRDYTFDSWMTIDPYYHTVTSLTGAGAAGTVTLNWVLPPDRFDRYKIRVRFVIAPGTITTITDGAEVTLGSDLPITVAHTPGAPGTYNYGVFAVYDDLAAPPNIVATNETSYSSPKTVSATV